MFNNSFFKTVEEDWALQLKKKKRNKRKIIARILQFSFKETI